MHLLVELLFSEAQFFTRRNERGVGVGPRPEKRERLGGYRHFSRAFDYLHILKKSN